MVHQGSGILLFAAGSMVETALTVHEILKEKGFDATIVNARFIRPFDMEMLKEQLPSHELLVTMEENVRSGGFGEHVESYVHFPGQKVLTIAIEDEYVEHGNVDLLKKKLGIDAASIAERILALQTGNR